VSDSRTDRFVADVRAWTGGEGVDVVLNSLSGELIQKSFDLLRDHGRFIELGKRDYYANNQLGLQPFLRNLSFSLVDLRGLVLKQPARGRARFEEVLGLVAAGVFTPLPITTVPITQAADAFWKMVQAQHIGKLVLTLEHPEVRVRVPTEATVAIRADGTYLVTGGLGGLGLSVAGWLAERGAGHLVLVGRSGAASAEQQAAVAALEARGARVTVARVDVANRAQLERLLAEVAASAMPLRGVIHTAGVLDDGVLMQLSPARFRTVMAPKALGALHLHELTREAPLDFFVLYASGSGLLGSPGQGNYAAANTFLDALAQHRRARGLPALSIDWGLFADVGLAAAQENRGARLVSRGMRSLTAGEGLWALERLLDGDRAHAAVLPIDVRQWVELYPAALFSRVLSRLVAAQRADAGRRTGDRDLLERLAAAEPGARAALLETLLRAQASQVLRIPEDKLDVDVPLTNLGMDSLMGLELRNRIEAALGVAVPAALGWTYPTVAAMTRWLLDKALAGSLGSGGGADAGKSAASAGGFVHLLHFRRVVSPRARIFCFHGAGGTPEAFHAWSAAPGWSDVEILALWHDRSLISEDAPGKRYAEEAASLILQHADVPFALLGVSLGVRFAMGTAYALAGRPDAPAPRALFMLGGGLNSLPINADMAAELLGKYFLIEQAAGQVRPTLQNHSDSRIDLAITDSMGLLLDDPKSPPSRLATPIVAVAGTNDGIMPPGDVQDLEFRTTGRFYIHFLPGDHQFLIEREPEIMQIVDSYLEPLLGRGART
jgi:polyketide synthase 12/epothilone polyketide synthase D